MGPLPIAGSLISSGITGYKIGKKLGKIIDEKIRDKTLSLTNKHRHRIWLVVMYKNNDVNEWMVKGWFGIILCDTFSYSFPGINNRHVYYCAICEECGSTWGRGDTTGYVPTTNEAFTNYNSDRIGELRDFSHVYLDDKDIETDLTGY